MVAARQVALGVDEDARRALAVGRVGTDEQHAASSVVKADGRVYPRHESLALGLVQVDDSGNGQIVGLGELDEWYKRTTHILVAVRVDGLGKEGDERIDAEQAH